MFECVFFSLTECSLNELIKLNELGKSINLVSHVIVFIVGRPEPTVSWFNGTEPIQTGGGAAMGRHVIVNRLEIPHLTRAAYNSTLRCQASNTKLAPPVERIVRLDMLCKYQNIYSVKLFYRLFMFLSCLMYSHFHSS